MKTFFEILKLQGTLNRTSSGQISNSVWVRIALNGFVFAFLGGNLFYRFSTIFDYSIFIKGLFVFLGVCSLFVILFPGYLRAFLLFFGASFFLFGFRSYDIQSQMFDTAVAFVAFTVFFVNLRRKNGAGSNRQLIALILSYIGLSLLSLLLLPVGHIAKDFWLFGFKTSLFQVANATPNTHLYPLAGVNRLVLFFIFALEASKGKEARELFKWIFTGIFSGAVFCAFVGLFDYYGIMSLAWYRFGTVTTPGVFHSTFLNRGWFAEFILTVVPFVLIGFISKVKGVWWKILLLGSLVLCEIALILAGARAGWVSYPLILFMCWLFFYFSKEGRLESFHFAWRDLVKIAVSVPITIAISFLLIFQVFMPLSDSLRNREDSKAPIVSSESTSQYIKAQTARIIDPSDRFLVWTQGVDVGRESPLFGMGYESFCWHANILAGIAESYYTVNKANKLEIVADDPHNIFLSLFVSGGFAGVGLWALIIGYGLMILVVDLVRNKRLLNVPVIISIISSHIYGVFQSTQYIPMIWFLVFLCLGYAMTLDEKVLPDRIRRIVGYAVKVMMFLVLIGGVVYFVNRGSQGLAEKYGLEVYAKDQDWYKYHGFYDREKWGETYYRWSGAKASVVISGQWSLGGGQMAGVGSRGPRVEGWRAEDKWVVEFDLQCHTPGVENEPVRVVTSLDGERIDDLWFDKKGSLKRQYYVGKKEAGVGHKFLFEVSRTWNPKRLGVSEDLRDLGVAVSEVRFLDKMPKDGVGFYDWETLGGGKIPGWPGNTLGRFRWTGMRASMLSTDYPSTIVPTGNKTSRTKQPSMTLFLMCAHPDIDKNPVVLKIMGDNELLKQETFVDHQWRKVLIKPAELNNSKILTFQVNRTWNPKAAGVSEDGRDLGVAIAAY